MEIERIATKLLPLIPSKVKYWLSVRATADPQMKSLIDRQILVTARKLLGDYENKLLLSLPLENLSRGAFHFGTVLYEKEKWPFGLSESELLQNLAIFGRSGAGKTNVAFHLLEQLSEKGVPFLFLDWKRTGRHLLPRLRKRVNLYTPGRSLAPFPFNPFIPPPNVEPRVYAHQLVDVLADAYTLGEGSKSLIQKALLQSYGEGNLSPTAEELVATVEGLKAKGREGQWRISALRALESLSLASLSDGSRETQEEKARKLLEESTILELNGLSQSSKQFLIPLLCLWLYSAKLSNAQREKLSLVILVEEAHHVFYGSDKRKETLMEQLLRQCRELGIAMLIVDQHPSLISQAALGNTYTTICLNLKDPSDINKAASICLLDDGDKHYLSELPIGQGIVKLQDRWRKPFLVRFPHVEIEKGSVTDEVLRRYLLEKPTHSALKRRIEPNPDGFRHFLVSDILLSEEGINFLKDVVKYPIDGVGVRYKRLGLGVAKGNRLKGELLRAGIFEAEEITVGRTRKLALRPTAKAREELRLDKGELTRESIAHEYWKRFYARLFEETGYRVELEAPRRNGRVDILALKPPETDPRASESVAIEIETGKSDVVWNVKQDLLSGFSKVLVVATYDEALKVVERRLAKAGLLIAKRVKIVVAGEEVSGEVGRSSC